MDKKYLIDIASKLNNVKQSSISEYQDKIDLLVGKMNTFMLGRTDINELIGEGGEAMMKDNHMNHARFIASILANFNPEVLVETVLWVFRSYRSHGFTTNYWSAQLNAWIESLKENLSAEAYKDIFPLYEWLLVNIPLFVKLSDEDLTSSYSLH